MNTCNCCENETENELQCKYDCDSGYILCDNCLCNDDYWVRFFIEFNDEYICWECFGTMKKEFEKNINIYQNDKDTKM